MSHATPGLVLAAACAAASVVGLLAWRGRRGTRYERAGGWAGRLCLVLAALVWGERWIASGHLPLFGTYESALSLSLAVLAATLLAGRGNGTWLWPVSCGIAAALLLHAVRFDAQPFPLTISERSWIVELHALLAWAAFGGLSVNAAVALAWLASRRAAGSLPAGLVHQSLSVGFLLHTAMLASGSLYKFLLFGQAWSFDPVETLGLVVWFGYGTLLHLHLMAGWEARRLAGWCLAVFVLLIVSYRGIVYFPAWSTYHIFDMDLRMHIGPSQGAGPPGGED